MTETPKRINSTLIDSTVQNALRKYSSVATQQGRTDRATLALELLSAFDKKAHANIVAQQKAADAALVAALHDYRQAVESQGRADRVAWVTASFVAFHSDPIESLRDELLEKTAQLDAKISALTAKKR